MVFSSLSLSYFCCLTHAITVHIQESGEKHPGCELDQSEADGNLSSHNAYEDSSQENERQYGSAVEDMKPQNILIHLSQSNKKLKYLLILQSQLHAILLHRIGMCLNKYELMRVGENQYSRTYYINANLPYSIIYSADYYQDLCMHPHQKAEIQRRETFLKNPRNLTTGESQDYNFENENKILKKILPLNPAFEDFRTSTLVKEDAEKIIENVKTIYHANHNPTREAGFPNYKGCVLSAREVIHTFIKEQDDFKNLAGKSINEDIIRFEDIADERRKVFFKEV